MNDIPNPILISDGFRFQDKIRRALKHEIDDYVRKTENPVSEDIRNEIAADIDGCPMKEIFHLCKAFLSSLSRFLKISGFYSDLTLSG